MPQIAKPIGPIFLSKIALTAGTHASVGGPSVTFLDVQNIGVLQRPEQLRVYSK